MNTDYRDIEHWVPLAQAADVLCRTPLNVLLHIKRGLLAGVEREDGWLVDPDSLTKLLQMRQEGEVSTVCQSACARKHGSCGSCA